KRSGPLTSGMSFGPTGPARGGATAFWTKDQMKAALEHADDDHDEPDDEPFRPAVGGGSATAFWSTAELAAMQQGSADAPRPKRSSKRSQTLMMAVPRPGEPARDPIDDEPDDVPTTREPVAPAPVASGPVASGPVASGPIAAGPVATAPGPIAAAPAAGRRRVWIAAAVGATALFLFSCLGLGGVVAWLLFRDDGATASQGGFTTAVPVEVAPTLIEEPPQEPPDEAGTPEAAPAEAPEPPREAPKPPAERKPARPASAPSPTPAAPAAAPK